jgi:hypothetical protein
MRSRRSDDPGCRCEMAREMGRSAATMLAVTGSVAVNSYALAAAVAAISMEASTVTATLSTKSGMTATMAWSDNCEICTAEASRKVLFATLSTARDSANALTQV